MASDRIAAKTEPDYGLHRQSEAAAQQNLKDPLGRAKIGRCAARGTAILAAVAVGTALIWCQTVGYNRGRLFDRIGKTYIYHRGWPLVYSEHFQPAMSRGEAMAPRWLTRGFLNAVCSVIGTASVAFVGLRLASSRWQFRLGTLLLLAAVVGGVCAFAPLERQLLTPDADWRFASSQPPHWRHSLMYGDGPLLASTALAFACTLQAAGHFVSRAVRALARVASRGRG